MRLISVLVMLGLTACTASTPQVTSESTPETEWRFDDHAAALRAASCPKGTEFKRANSLTIEATEIERGSAKARGKAISGMDLAGAWHLVADNPEFGGLSGLDVLTSGSLIAVTDDGKFAWIGIDPETGAPDGLGAIAYLRDESGDIFPNKRAADAEDLAFRDGLAFVSFEQDYRIAAYDLEGCGVAARAAPVSALSQVVDGHLLKNNRGPEALAFADQNLMIGFETHDNGGSPKGRLLIDGALADIEHTDQPGFFLLTGMDAQDRLTASVFRAYDPVRKTRVIVQIGSEQGLIAEATLKPPLPVDNFEGIAFGESPDGHPRIWLIADDNFNSDQRTLLLALDLAP